MNASLVTSGRAIVTIDWDDWGAMVKVWKFVPYYCLRTSVSLAANIRISKSISK